VRFHCRLSHVAAHTAILSVNFLDAVTDPARVASRLEAFLIPAPRQESGGGGAENAAGRHQEQQDDDLAAIKFIADDDQGGLYVTQERFATRILTRIQSTTGVHVNRLLDQVLVEEMVATRNLTVWPCPSFWAAGDPDGDPLDMSPIVKRIAKSLSPDCDDPFGSCWVARDKCEARGDGLCNENKEERAAEKR